MDAGGTGIRHRRATEDSKAAGCAEIDESGSGVDAEEK
jgi:hypothetical protein